MTDNDFLLFIVMIVAQKDAENITCDIHTITCIIFRNHALTAIYGELNIYVNIYVISRKQLLFIFRLHWSVP